MARRLRIHVPDGWYHVMSLGNGREVIHRTDEDRHRFLRRVAELPKRFGTGIHAFVRMDNRQDWGRDGGGGGGGGGGDATSGLAVGGGDAGVAGFTRRLKAKCQ